MLEFAENRNFQGRNSLIVYPLMTERLSLDGFGRILERIKARNEDLGEEEQSLRPRIEFVEPPQDACGHYFTENRSAVVDIVSAGKMFLLVEKLCSIYQKTVHCNSG